jgi:hypothetical protein
MRPLWPIERQVLEITAAEYPASADALRRQMDTAQVVSFENSGAGFFSNIAVAADAPLVGEKGHLNAGYGSVCGIEDGMGFIVFLKEGRLSLIEGYCNSSGPTNDIDFSRAAFELKPWSPTPDQGGRSSDLRPLRKLMIIPRIRLKGCLTGACVACGDARSRHCHSWFGAKCRRRPPK